MAIKTTGAEFKRFYSDEEFWPEDHDVYHDDECITINGEEIDGAYDLAAVPDDSRVNIEGGCVYDGRFPEKEQSFEGYFRKWRKKQSTATLIVEASKDRIDLLVEAIKEAGGKICKV